jgi:hypothetical protein
MEDSGKIITHDDLREAIMVLEERRKEESALLKRQFEVAYESVKPINLVRSTLKDLVTSDGLKTDVLNSTIGLAAGVVSRSLFVGFSGNPLRKLVGTMVMFGVTKLVARNGDKARTIGRHLLGLVSRKLNFSVKKQLPEEIK